MRMSESINDSTSYFVQRTSQGRVGMEKIQSFKQLKIWQKGIEISKKVYALTNDFPKEEVYGLRAQMRRASVSIPSNIAEGFKRYHAKEYKQFLHITLGSSAELETQGVIAHELGFMGKDHFVELSENLDHLDKMISS